MADLLRRGIDSFHIYTLNRAELTEAVCRFCGIVPDRERAAAYAA
jgi:methylenetetrahydrofolate reductase (NADPH)